MEAESGETWPQAGAPRAAGKAQRLGGRQQEACGAAAGWVRGARSGGGEVSGDHWGLSTAAVQTDKGRRH